MESTEVRGHSPLRRLLVHGGLLVLTFASMTVAFSAGQSAEPLAAEALADALFFSVPALLILGAHELGHYFMAVAHGVPTSLPYFLPFPFGFGTLGAVIRLKGRIPTRDALFDIGAAGPLAGLAIAVPLLLVGVAHSFPVASPPAPFPANLSLWQLAVELGHWVRGALDGVTAAEPTGAGYSYFGDNLLTWVASRAVWGKLPAGTDLAAHPVFIAAWFGLVITMLNLLPVGQLDGGHVTRAVFGDRAERFGPHVVSALLVLSLFSASWLVWVLLVTRVVGFGHPPPVDDLTPLSPGRRRAAIFTWVLTVLCFVPVPLDFIGT